MEPHRSLHYEDFDCLLSKVESQVRALSRDMTGYDLYLEDYLHCSVGNKFRIRVQAGRTVGRLLQCICFLELL